MPEEIVLDSYFIFKDAVQNVIVAMYLAHILNGLDMFEKAQLYLPFHL